MKLPLRYSAVLFGLLLPLVSTAIAPSYVTGLQAELSDGEVYVSWNTEPSENIEYYRVYYSFESILENDGLYDDYEETEGPDTFFVIENPPSVAFLYVAVTAVNEDGEDSGIFVEEVSVDMTTSDSDPSDVTEEEEDTTNPPPVTTQPEVTEELEELDELEEANEEEVVTLPGSTPGSLNEQLEEEKATTLSVLSAESLSPTEVRVTFSGPVLVEPKDAPDAFSITDAFGNSLVIEHMRIDGADVTITTATQQSDRVYEFSVTEPAYSTEGLPLDTVSRRAFFNGHTKGETVTTPTTDAPAQLQGVQNFALQATLQTNGFFTVTAEWKLVGDMNQLKNYAVQQTRDGGITFSETEVLAANIGSIRLQDVTPGLFGLSLKLMRTDGTTIPGGFDSIQLGAGPTVPQSQSPASVSTPTASVTQTGDVLATTGAGAIALSMAIAGGLVGWRRTKKITTS